jgi:aquaporin Z
MLEKLIVEFLGTLFFLYVILATGKPVPIALALAIIIYLGGSISGGMFNPAVSVMMSVAGKLPVNQLLPYVAAQVLGGLAAYEIHKRT